MLSLHWLSQLWSPGRGQPLRRERIKERRLKLMRLEQRRVLNADFSFTPHALTLSQVDGDLSVREVSSGLTSRVEFDLTGGSIWHDDGSTGTFAIDNSTPGHSILSVEKSDLENLTGGVSLSAAASAFDLHFDVHSSSLDLSHMQGMLVAEGFGNIGQTGSSSHEVQVADVSLSASHINLSNFHGDDITLNASEVDLSGGHGSFSGTTLSVLSGTTGTIELGGVNDDGTELNFTDRDIAALDAGFTSVHFHSSALTVDESGADFRDALSSHADSASEHFGSLHLEAATVQIHGDLTSNGGTIEIDATDTLTVSATGAVIDHGGDVHLDAGRHGTLLIAGDVDVSDLDAGDSGGTVHLLGERVGLFGDARVDASGDSGGGELLIGGDAHGDNGAIPHAARVFVGHDVELHADALQHGDGGKLIVWSDDVTQVYGTLTARGGADSGDGGFIETSSLGQLLLTSGGDASAANGHAGTWLLDPLNVRVVSISAIYGVTEFATPPNFNPTISGSEVTAIAIVEQLESGTTVIITTRNPDFAEDGDVIVEADLTVNFLNAGDSASFIISAANDVFINGKITATNGSLNVLLEANENSDDLDTSLGNVNVNADIDTNGGLFVSTGVDFDSAGVKAGNTAATITATGGVSITHSGLVDLGAISTGTEFGGTTFISGANVRGNIDVGEGNLFIDGGNDDLLVAANITSTDTMFLLADGDVIIEATVTAGGPAFPLSPTADLKITADAESNGVGGVWLRETGNVADARLNAGGNISLVGAKLIDPAGNISGTVSLRIDASDVASDPQIVAGEDLTIVANFGHVSDAGDIVIDGVLQATDGDLTAFFTGTTFLSANPTAGNDLTFQNAVQLTNDVTLTAGNDLTIGSTIDDDGDGGTGSALTVNAGRDALFVGVVGGAVAPGLDALNVTSDGLIDFLQSVTVDGPLVVTATSEVGRVTFQDVVTTTNGGSVTITNAGLLVTSSKAEFHLASDFLQNGGGSTELGASIFTADGTVQFDQAVVLTGPVTIDSSGNNRNITFGSSIDSEVTGANEEQALSLVDVTGGSFTISWGPPGGAVETTDPIPFDATAADVKAALVALDALTDADIDVVGDPGSFYTLIFRGAYRGTDVDPIVATDVDLTGGTPELSVLTVVEGQPVVAEHNPLTLVAGTGQILFQGDIGNGFVDLDLGVDGDQTLGDLTIKSANMVTFDGVTTVNSAGTIDLGADGVIPNGILITGGTDPITFQSDQDIRVNGVVTSEVDLSLVAAGKVTLTDDGSLFTTTNNSNVTIVADSNGDSVGDLVMNPLTQIDAGSGFIDVRAAEVFLGKLTSASTNPTDADNPAIRVVATFRAINDINGDELNLVANQRLNPDDPGAGVVLDAVLGIGSNETNDDALETDIASLSAFNHDRSEQQSVTLQHANAGSFTISWEPPDGSGLATTDPIPFNASADQVKTLFLQAFSSLTTADVDISGRLGGPFVFTFLGTLRSTDVEPLMVDGAGLIGVGTTATAATIADPVPARNNVVLHDVGTTAGRVDLIFVHNEANQLEPQFATATEDFGTGTTAFAFSAATPGPLNNDIVINFTASQHTGPTFGVPIIVVTGHTIDIDLDVGEDLNQNGVLDPGEDLNRNHTLEGTTANALRDAINGNHQANQLIQARITTPYETGFNNITPSAVGASVSLSGAGDEQGVIDINIESGDLRVVADNSRPLFLEMRDGIDEFNPTDLAVAAIQSENTIRLKANTIEVFDDILAIQPLTQISNAIDESATTFTVIDPRVFPTVDGDPGSTDFYIQINSEILAVTDIVGHELTVVRGESGTTATSHVAATVIANINVDNGIRQYIDIQARTNFVLGADRVISTDDHYINSLHVAEDLNGNGVLDNNDSFVDANGNGVFDAGESFTDLNGNNLRELLEPYYDANHNGQFDPSETFADSNGNKKYDSPEDFDHDGALLFNPGEDTNRDGILDPGEDLNGDGLLQLRGNKPITIAQDEFFANAAHDSIHITADSTFSGSNGRVLLGDNSTISTDVGITQQISPRPFKNLGTDAQHSEYTANSSYFSGEIVASNLQSRFLTAPEQLADGRILPTASIVYLGTLTFTIGAPGEKNLILDIDWGDHDRTVLSPVPPVLANTLAPKFANGIYVFDAKVDQHATRFLIPEGGATYSIPHDFPDAALNLKDFLTQLTIQEPGRTKPTDPFNVRFAVSQHSSIVIDGQSVLDPSVKPEDVATFAPADVPQNAPYDSNRINKPYAPDDPSISPTGADPLFQLSSTNVLDDPHAFLPRVDNGVVAFTIPTSRAVAFIPKPDPVNAPIELPKVISLPSSAIAPALLTTESSRGSAASSSVTTDEYFELRRINEDGSIEITERLTGENDGELLLGNRELFEKFINERGDGSYEIWFITKDTRDGALIERPVIQFHLESGRIATSEDEAIKTFQPLKLIPVPAPPKPADPANNGDGNAAAEETSAASDENLRSHADGNDQPETARLVEAPRTDLPKSNQFDRESVFSPNGLSAGGDDSPAMPHTKSEEPVQFTDPNHSSTDTTTLAAGALILVGTGPLRRRFNATNRSLFSVSSRWTRKLSGQESQHND